MTATSNRNASGATDSSAPRSLARLVMEAAGKDRGALESVAPLSFLLLVAVMAVLSWRGTLSPSAATATSKHPAAWLEASRRDLQRFRWLEQPGP